MKKNAANKRISILMSIFTIITLVIIVRIIYLSSLPSDEYTILQDNQNIIKRGDIVDRNQRILAVNDELYSIYANPKEIIDPIKSTEIISEILSLNKKNIYEKVTSRKKFIWIKRQVSPEEYNRIKKSEVKGFYGVEEYKRIYPNKTLSANILGFCNIDNAGVEGIEKSLDKYLVTNKNNDTSMQNGLNVQLTIDSVLQAAAEKALIESSINEGAEIGSLILLDGYSGEILSLANYPTYDPNNYSNYKQQNFRNNAIFYQYEPGSVFKIFSISSILDNGGITPDTVFYCSGFYEKGPYKIKCTGVHHYITMKGVFKHSCNVGTLQAAENITNYELYHYLKSFGFGELTNIGLPGEQAGVLRKITDWTDRSMLSVPLGQEISVNAMQIVRAATTFVNDGVLLNPYIVKKIYDNNGKIIIENNRKEIRRVLSPGISDQIIEAMSDSTSPGGSVQKLKVEGINFAAKSGTAQIFDFSQGKYSNQEVSASLIVLFPLEKPRYIAYAVFHKPTAKVNWGGVICSTLLNNFLGNITGYLDIKTPEYKISTTNILNTPMYEKITKLPYVMPDFTGLSGGDSLNILSETGIKVKIYGQGHIHKQTPLPGTILNKKSTVEFYLKQ